MADWVFFHIEKAIAKDPVPIINLFCRHRGGGSGSGVFQGCFRGDAVLFCDIRNVDQDLAVSRPAGLQQS